MCGPIALMLPVNRKNYVIKTVQILTYNLGRIFAYCSLGLLFGLLGRGVFLAGFQQQLSILMGILMIIFALVPEKIFAQYTFSKPIYKIISKVKFALGNQFKKKSSASIFFIGLFNGYLPCGMVYVALFGAIAMPSLLQSVLYMMFFGLGTVALMSLVIYFSSTISLNFRNKIQKIIPIIIIIMGMLFIIRGLGLNIPYISPSNTSLYIQQEADCH